MTDKTKEISLKSWVKWLSMTQWLMIGYFMVQIHLTDNVLDVVASLERKQVCLSVQKAWFYSLMVDERKDLSKQEQISIVVPLVDSDTDPALIGERFHTFHPAATLNAEGLTTYILEAFYIPSLRFHSMMETFGVQQQVYEEAPHAVYVHCHGHILHLVLVPCNFFLCSRSSMSFYHLAKYTLPSSRNRSSTLTNQQRSLSI